MFVVSAAEVENQESSAFVTRHGKGKHRFRSVWLWKPIDPKFDELPVIIYVDTVVFVVVVG